MIHVVGRRKELSLRTRILMFLLAVGIITLGSVAVLVQPRLMAAVDQVNIREARQALEVTGNNLLPFLIQNQYAGIHENLDELRSLRPTWRRMELIDKNQRHLYPLRSDSQPSGDGLEKFSYDIQFRGETLATLTVWEDFSADRAQVRSLGLSFSIIFAMAFGGAILLIGLFLEFAVSRRARFLSLAADRIAHRDYSVRLPDAGSDEIGDLVRSFATMRDAVRDYEVSLSDSQAELQATLGEFRDLIARIPLGVCKFRRLQDGGMRFDYVSERWCEQLGVSADAVLADANVAIQCIHPQDRLLFLQAAESARQTLQPFVWEGRIGEGVIPRWMHVEASAVQMANGDVLWNGVQIDITVRKESEAELEAYRQHLEELVAERTAALSETEARATHLLQSSADGLYGTDREGRITFANSAACTMLGYTVDQIVGQPAHALFHHTRTDGTPYPAAECPSLAAVREGRQIRVDDEVYWCADGRPLPVMYAVHPVIRNGINDGAVVSFVDMSEQRAAAEAREQALIAAENLARVRSEFLANMSHEIRTPLNGVLGFAQIGYRNHQDSDKVRNAFEKIITSGKLLLGVINDILDFSKIEAGKIQIESTRVSLDEVMGHALELVGERARAKGLALNLERSPGLPRTCMGDPLRLSQVLLNVLSNAVKFTEQGSVTLTVAVRGEDLVFRVTDTGIGISPEHMPQLFSAFQQADSSTTRRFGGTGLGLAISKRILEMMGGGIRVESTPGVGSVFEFHLPYLPAEAGGAADVAAAGSTSGKGGKPLQGVRILVAEDDEINRMVLEENLIADGATVAMAGNGAEAVARIADDGGDAYDIVLMDVQMPEMDGYEATRLIHGLAPTLPVIGQTAHASVEERGKCLAAGMADHIAKPIDADRLVQLVRQQIELKKAHRWVI